MKYLFSVIILLLMSIAVDAQKINTFTGSDTIVNTATVNLDYPHPASVAFKTGAFQVINTKLSGTAAGKTYFMGSVDGTNFVKLDSLTNTNQTTNTKTFIQAPPAYPYYRFSSTGSGTMSVITTAKVHFKAE